MYKQIKSYKGINRNAIHQERQNKTEQETKLNSILTKRFYVLISLR